MFRLTIFRFTIHVRQSLSITHELHYSTYNAYNGWRGGGIRRWRESDLCYQYACFVHSPSATYILLYTYDRYADVSNPCARVSRNAGRMYSVLSGENGLARLLGKLLCRLLSPARLDVVDTCCTVRHKNAVPMCARCCDLRSSAPPPHRNNIIHHAPRRVCTKR